MENSGVKTKKHSMQRGVVERRKGALKRLEQQLVKGVTWRWNPHLTPNSTSKNEEVPLSQQDRQRIQKEIEILKGRI